MRSLSFMAPNNFVPIINDNINEDTEQFMTIQESNMVRASAPANIAGYLANNIVTLGQIHLYISSKSLEICQALNLPLPNNYNQNFMQSYNIWYPNSVTQRKIDSIDRRILASSTYCEATLVEINNDLASVSAWKDAVKAQLREAHSTIDAITKTDGNTRKRMLYSEIEVLMPEINANYLQLRQAHTRLFAKLNMYNRERTKAAGYLVA